MTTTDISVSKPSLQELKKRKERFGSLGVLDFLIAHEESKGRSDRLKLLRQYICAPQKTEIKSVKPNIKSSNQKKKVRNKVEILRTKLLSLGFTEEPLAELEVIAKKDSSKWQRAKAAQVVALWYLRVNTPESCQMALTYIELAKSNVTDPKSTRLERLAVAEIMCYVKLNNQHNAQELFNSLQKKQQLTPDLWLAWTNFQKNEEERIVCINQALAAHSVPPVALMPQRSGQNLPAYDRLVAATTPSAIHDGPKVTVLVAAYNCPDTLPTCLRSLEEQSWKNLEVIVLDDYSPTLETFEIAQKWATKDPRFKAIRMPENGGAYVARNHGLSIATGKFVTLHDADDWSHPLKIETQVRHLEESPDIVANMTQTFRLTENLDVLRWSGNGSFILTNVSSFMFRRKKIVENIGYWDRVRFSADSEFIDRIKYFFGQQSVVILKGLIYSIQRDSVVSMIRDTEFGIHQMAHGARRQYKEVQEFHHGLGNLKYDIKPSKRPFPVPRCMVTGKLKLTQREHFGVIIASDFRMLGGSTHSNTQEILCQAKNDIGTGILPMFRYDFQPTRKILSTIWNQVDGERVKILSAGDVVSCDVLIVRYPPVLYHRLRYMPNIQAKEIRVIVNQPPMSDYGPNGVVRYKLKACAENIRYYFGKDATWHPIGPQARSALLKYHTEELKYVHLADWDWSNIVDINGWRREVRKRGSGNILRIGRHSRDHEHKWPESPQDLLAAYPESKDLEVHILGGANVPVKTIGHHPSNWTVYEYDSIHPKDFLANIDIFIYFTNSHWVEAFGRVIIEAMAVGVPVILPDIYQPLFKESALYATPQTAVALARELHANPQMYNEQVRIAQDYVRKHFSYQTHLNRLRDLGVVTPQNLKAEILC